MLLGSGSFFGGASGGGSTSMVYSYEGSSVDNANASSYTFTSKNIGAAGAGRVIAVGVAVNVSSIGTPRNITGVTADGVAMTAGPSITGGSTGQGSTAWFYLTIASGTTATFVVTTNSGVTNCTIVTYRLFPVSSTPVDTTTASGSNSAVLTDLEVKTGGLALVIANVTTGTPTTGSWSGVDTPTQNEADLTNDRPGPTNAWSIPTTENDTTRDFTVTQTGSTIRSAAMSFQ